MGQKYDVLTLVNCERPPIKIGVAEDVGEEGTVQTCDSIVVRLDALPLNGRLVLRRRPAE